VLRGGTISGAAHVVALHARLGHEAHKHLASHRKVFCDGAFRGALNVVGHCALIGHKAHERFVRKPLEPSHDPILVLHGWSFESVREY
jgi:hypothetical protein